MHCTSEKFQIRFTVSFVSANFSKSYLKVLRIGTIILIKLLESDHVIILIKCEMFIVQ